MVYRTHFWSGMHTGDEFGPRTITLIVLKQKLSSLFVQGRLGIWIDKQTFDGDKDVSDPV
jgi:hypothetical protein